MRQSEDDAERRLSYSSGATQFGHSVNARANATGFTVRLHINRSIRTGQQIHRADHGDTFDPGE